MYLFRIPVVLLILASMFPGLAGGKQGLSSDLITMKNGDIHNGTVAREMFTLETPYGKVSIPYNQKGQTRLKRSGLALLLFN